MREQQVAGAGLPGSLAGFGGAHVAAAGWLSLVLGRMQEGRLAHEQVGVAGSLDQLRTGPDI